MRTMRISLVLAGLALSVFCSEAFAQGDNWYVSAANWARYYHFKDTKEDSAATRFQFDVGMGNFYGGAWYELKHYVSDFTTLTADSITQLYFGWEDDGLTLHVGSFYQAFDRGLILNAFLDDDVGFNLPLDGFKASGKFQYLDFDFFTATPPSTEFARWILRGARVKAKPLKVFHVGGGYVRLIENHAFFGNNKTNLEQVNARFNYGYFDGYVEYARRDGFYVDPLDPVNPVKDQDGDGTYVNISTYYSDFTGFFEYKNYKFLSYHDPTLFNFNQPPPVNHQQRSLQSQLEATGERGYRIGLSYSPNYYWGFEADFAEARSRDRLKTYMNEKYFEARGNYYKNNFFIFSYDRLEYSEQNEITPKFEISYLLNSFYSITLTTYLIKFELLMDETAGTDYTEKYIDLNFAKSYAFNLTIGGSLSNRDISSIPNADPKRMAYVELNLKFRNHDLILFNGGQRGGWVCAGGLCTFTPTFQGTRVTLLSRF